MFVKILELPHKSELEIFLPEKLTEYEIRINVYQDLDAMHKYFVLCELLKYKILDTDKLREKAKGFLNISFNELLFQNAVGVIYNYCYSPDRNAHPNDN